jgi:carbonic anhydrase
MTNAVMPAREALARLQEGNKRFASNVRSVDSLLSQLRRADLAQRQEPFAIILGCSDSRAPAEIVFDQGLGDLFVIRVAGNVVAPSQVGSVEFAAERFGTRLVVVLGHTGCGAIEAAIDASQQHAEVSKFSKNQLSIVDRVRPSVEELLTTPLRNDRPSLAAAAMRANVRASVYQLRHGSPVLEDLIDNDGLLVVGAAYDIASGAVDFFHGV